MKFDEIGGWSKIKLDVIQEYIAAYTTILSRQAYFKFYYADAFSGAGAHTTNETKQMAEGSPLRVLSADITFDKYYFIDLDGDKANHLREQCRTKFPDKKVEVTQGDCNEVLKNIVPGMEYSKYERVLCLLDPYGLHLDWEIIEMMGTQKVVDLILNFPIMDMNRNAIWRDPKGASMQQKSPMTRFWGDDSWLRAAYAQPSQSNLFGEGSLEKQPNEAIVGAFQNRLKDTAGFKFVPNPLPMKNGKGATVYYLFFASQNATAEEVAKSIFRKYEG